MKRFSAAAAMCLAGIAVTLSTGEVFAQSSSEGSGQSFIAAPPSPDMTPVMFPIFGPTPAVMVPPSQPAVQPAGTPVPSPAPYPAAAPPPSFSTSPSPAAVPRPSPALYPPSAGTASPSTPSAVSPAGVPPAGNIRTVLSGRLPNALHMHGSAIVGNRLYVFGGETDAGWTNRAWSTTINKNGTINGWQPARDLPEARAYISNAVQSSGDRIYIVGGLIPSAPNAPENAMMAGREVLWTSVLADGSLAPWQRSEAFLPEGGLYNMASAASEKHLYAVGGYYGKKVSNAVYGAQLGEGGAPVNWRRVATLPVPLWFHGAAVVNGRLYVWGGLTARNNLAINYRVVSAAMEPDGSLGDWVQEPPMDPAVYSAACCTSLGRLFSITGRIQGGAAVPNITSLAVDGETKGKWKTWNSDIEARMYHSCAVDPVNEWILVTGGRHRSGREGDAGHLVDVVQAFRFPR